MPNLYFGNDLDKQTNTKQRYSDAELRRICIHVCENCKTYCLQKEKMPHLGLKGEA